MRHLAQRGAYGREHVGQPVLLLLGLGLGLGLGSGLGLGLGLGSGLGLGLGLGSGLGLGLGLAEPVLLLPLALCGGRTLLRCEEQGEGVRRVEDEAVVLVAMVRR